MWNKPIFQRAFFGAVIFLLLAVIVWISSFWIFPGIGRPPLGIAMGIDFSSSTYTGGWLTEDSLVTYEIEAAKKYLEENEKLLLFPNQIKIYGFASSTTPLTTKFSSDSAKNKEELDENLPQDISFKLLKKINTETNLNEAINAGIDFFKREFFQPSDRFLNRLLNPFYCRQVLFISDGKAENVDELGINILKYFNPFKTEKLRVNAIILYNEDDQHKDLQKNSALVGVVNSTKGSLLMLKTTDLMTPEDQSINEFFRRVNNNRKWVRIWVLSFIISLVWIGYHPLDDILQKKLFNLNMNQAGTRVWWFSIGFSVVILLGILHLIFMRCPLPM